MPTLWLAQREFGWLSEPVLEYVAALMELPLAWVTSVASFYTMYWKEPKGRWHVQVCRNLSCQLRGARRLAPVVGSLGPQHPATGVRLELSRHAEAIRGGRAREGARHCRKRLCRNP